MALLVPALAAAAAADTLTLLSNNEIEDGNFGHAVAGIPDLDGDGLDDVIVGAPGENPAGFSEAGRIYIYSGATGDLIRVNSSPSDTLNGHFGWAVTGVPDLNGDGRGDYVVGAPGEGAGGRAYVFSGANGALIRTHNSGNPVGGGSYGAAVSGIDDLNLDGLGDYIIGAPKETVSGMTQAGRAYVVSGGTGTILATKVSPNGEVGGQFGASVSGVPDTNSDNRGEYVIGAPFEDPGAAPVDSGRAYLFGGATHLLLFTFASGHPEAGGQFGICVSGVPDVGGFGGGDVIVGAPFETVELDGVDYFNAGRAYIFSGTGGGLGITLIEPSSNIDDSGQFGRSVAGLRDVDGDGLGDVIVGAPSWPGYHAYVFAAQPQVLVATLTSPDGFGADQFWGGAVGSAGDVNGDGRGDYIVGGRGADNFPADPGNAGRARLYRPLGNDGCGPAWETVMLADGDNFFTTIGATEGDPEDGCVQFADPGPDVWFRYEATCTGTLVVSTCSQASFNTKVAVYPNCGPLCGFGDPIGCNDNAPFGSGCSFGTSILEVPVEAGSCYRIRVGGAANQSGTGILTLACSACTPADLSGDGVVDGADLGILLANWGAAGASDLNGDGITDGADLGVLLSAWGTTC
ncbi:MAG: FG-GAP repeat protein [Phycisphaerales bacterium]|nr:FG-GAP repeat protein [Phycisphaerales bacterium]